MNYLGKFSPSSIEVCGPLRKLTSSKCEWAWNSTYHNLYDRDKDLIKKNASMEFLKRRIALYRNRCIGGRSQSNPSASEGWNVVLKE